MTNEKGLLVGAGDSGERLDRFLSRSASVSLRAARRLVERGAARVDGVLRGASFKLRAGQAVSLAPQGFSEDANPPKSEEPLAGEPRLIVADERHAAFFKPSGLHTVSLAGGDGQSLESLLPSIYPDRKVLLVNRLDQDTSGIVLGVFSEAASRRFRQMEDAGQVDKRYLALVQGVLEKPLVLKWALDTADRAKVKVLGEGSPDPLRWTRVRPLGPQDGRTLVEARIAKGARHQIRAHLSRAGYPIVGDGLYGQSEGLALRLHHWCLRFPEFLACTPPPWDELKTSVELFGEDDPCACT